MFDQGDLCTASIAYIPLDDRPVNTTRAALLARSAGFSLIMPEKDLYRTSLDGQPRNANGSQFGDGNALLDWLENCPADYCVISVDQILSGGLVNSRHEMQIRDEMQRIDRLLALLEGKQVILFDTVMRLAPTVGYKGCTLEDYQALREYGSLPRTQLTDNLTADGVISGYAVSSDLDKDLIEPYLAARSRKLRIAEYLLEAVAEKENISLLYGIDDSRPGNTIQTNEIALIRANLKNGYIFAGTDEMGLLSVTKIIGQHYGDHAMPTISIQYFGAKANQAADEYDAGTLEQNLQDHCAALGVAVDGQNYHMELLVYGSGQGEPSQAAQALLQRYRENCRNRIPTMIVDLGDDFQLPAQILSDPMQDFSCLLAYSAWNTAGNSIGIALSNGVARYLYLRSAKAPVEGASSAFLQGLYLSFAKDIAYARIKPELEADSIPASCKTLARMREDPLGTAKIANMLADKPFLLALSPWQTGTIPHFTVTDIYFPWGRTFEAELEIGLS